LILFLLFPSTHFLINSFPSSVDILNILFPGSFKLFPYILLLSPTLKFIFNNPAKGSHEFTKFNIRLKSFESLIFNSGILL